jgi:hypothetical protein
MKETPAQRRTASHRLLRDAERRADLGPRAAVSAAAIDEATEEESPRSPADGVPDAVAKVEYVAARGVEHHRLDETVDDRHAIAISAFRCASQ